MEGLWLAGAAVGAHHGPTVVSRSPLDGAARVAIDTRELSVAFDTDMQPTVCVNAPCDQGVCYDHARWSTPRTLTIAVDPKLLPKHDYSIGLGARSCHLKSVGGYELPVTIWRFRTE